MNGTKASKGRNYSTSSSSSGISRRGRTPRGGNTSKTSKTAGKTGKTKKKKKLMIPGYNILNILGQGTFATVYKGTPTGSCSVHQEKKKASTSSSTTQSTPTTSSSSSSSSSSTSSQGDTSTCSSSNSSSSSSSSSNVLYDTSLYSEVALKVFTKRDSIQTGLREIKCMRMFYNAAGQTRKTTNIVLNTKHYYKTQNKFHNKLHKSFQQHKSQKTSSSKTDSDAYSDDDDFEDQGEETTLTELTELTELNDESYGTLNLDCYNIALQSIGRLLQCLEIPNMYDLNSSSSSSSSLLCLTYELCGETLSSQLYSMKGEFYKSERIYKVTQNILHQHLFENNFKLLKILMKTILEVLLLLDDCGIFHCDLKPENILIVYDSIHQRFLSIKIIDFGSSVDVHNIIHFDTITTTADSSLSEQRGGKIKIDELPNATTPEYVSPELLGAREGTFGQNGTMTLDYNINPDMWALGSIFLEIVSGFPLWFPYKSRIPRQDSESRMSKDFWMMKGGLLAVSSREPFAILRKQKYISENMKSVLCKCPGRGLSRDTLAMHFLSEMFQIDVKERVRPEEQLRHPWLEGIVLKELKK